MYENPIGSKRLDGIYEQLYIKKVCHPRHLFLIQYCCLPFNTTRIPYDSFAVP